MKRKILAAVAAAVVLAAGCSEVPEEKNSEKTDTNTSVAAESETEETLSETEDTSSAAEEVPEEEDDSLYDTTPISQAYLTGDSSALDDMQRDILKRAEEVIAQCVTDDMTDYEKELAIHDYIITNVTYDKGELSIFGEAGEHAADPYGALYDGQCICSGYTTTFQMFMDMLEIPCISMKAAADGGEDHAWNMAQINGHWYYVDVTWDDPVPDKDGRPIEHKYFNTSREVMQARHEWDSSTDPANDSVEDSYISHELAVVESPEDVLTLLESAIERGTGNVYFEVADPSAEGWYLEEADDVDKYIYPNAIHDDLSVVYNDFMREYKSHFVRWQRIEHDGKIIVAAYISKL